MIATFRSAHPDVSVNMHTCGPLHDRLELLEETATAGTDALDPLPLGDVDLADAKRRVGERLLLKDNIDSVNTVLRGTPEQCAADRRRCLDVAMRGAATSCRRRARCRRTPHRRISLRLLWLPSSSSSTDEARLPGPIANLAAFVEPVRKAQGRRAMRFE